MRVGILALSLAIDNCMTSSLCPITWMSPFDFVQAQIFCCLQWINWETETFKYLFILELKKEKGFD